MLEGTGGIKSLGDDDKADIKQTIDEEVLKGTAIEFRSSEVQGGAGAGLQRERRALSSTAGSAPVTFELASRRRRPHGGQATVKQTASG